MYQWVQKKTGKCRGATMKREPIPGVLSALIHHALYGGPSPGNQGAVF